MRIDRRGAAMLWAVLAALSFSQVATSGEWTMSQLDERTLTSTDRAGPIVTCTADELARLRAAYRGDGPARPPIARVVAQADRALDQPLEFPPRGGQHNQWYQCEPCQTGLETVDATHHRCPNCGTVYSGPPYDDAVMSHRHRDNLKAAADCAWAYAITGEQRYADRAAQVLLGYAQRYSTYELHDNRLRTGADAHRSGGRLLEQTLGEASMLVHSIVPAYDLIRETLDQSERERIEDALLRPMLETIAGHPAGKSNWQTWHNAAMLWGGAVLRDEAWVRRALTAPDHGFAFQMDASVTADGAWYENSWSYHFYTLSAMTALAEGARRIDIDLWSHPTLRKMHLLPMRYTLPDGTLPRFGDALTTSVRDRAPMIEAAWHAYREPALLPALGGRPTWESIMFGRETAGDRVDLATPRQSELFPAAGHAILRSDGPAGLAAAMTFGPFGGAHDHFDKLGFVFFGHGRELGVDPGRARSQAYRLPIHKHWYRATLGHNAVLVDNASQDQASGTLELFATGTDVAAVRASVSAWPGVTQSRLLVLLPEYLLVFDELDAEKVHRFDWLYHNHGAAAESDAATRPATLGDQIAGAEYLRDIRGGATDEPVRVRFAAGAEAPDPAVTTFVTLDAQPGTELVVADGPLDTVQVRVPMMMVGRSGRHVRFAAAIEPIRAGAEPTVRSVTLTEADDELTVTVSRARSTDRIRLTPDGSLRVDRDGDQRLASPAQPR